MDVVKLKDRLLELVEELRLARVTINENEKRINHLLSQCHDKERVLEEETSRHHALKAEHAEALSSIRRSYDSRIEHLEAEKKKLQLNSESWEREMRTLKDDIRNLQLSKYNLEKTVREQAHRLHTQSQNKSAHSQQVGEIENKCKDAMRKMATCTEALATLEKEVAEARRLNKLLEFTNRHQACQVSTLEATVEEKQKDIIELKTKYAQKRDGGMDGKKEADKMIAVLQQNNQQLLEGNVALQNQLKDVRKSRKVMQEQLYTEAHNLAQRCLATNKEMTQKTADMEARMEELVVESGVMAADKTKAMDNLNQICQKLKDTEIQRDIEIKDLRDQVQRLKEEYEAAKRAQKSLEDLNTTWASKNQTLSEDVIKLEMDLERKMKEILDMKQHAAKSVTDGCNQTDVVSMIDVGSATCDRPIEETHQVVNEARNDRPANNAQQSNSETLVNVRESTSDEQMGREGKDKYMCAEFGPNGDENNEGVQRAVYQSPMSLETEAPIYPGKDTQESKYENGEVAGLSGKGDGSDSRTNSLGTLSEKIEIHSLETLPSGEQRASVTNMLTTSGAASTGDNENKQPTSAAKYIEEDSVLVPDAHQTKTVTKVMLEVDTETKCEGDMSASRGNDTIESGSTNRGIKSMNTFSDSTDRQPNEGCEKEGDTLMITDNAQMPGVDSAQINMPYVRDKSMVADCIVPVPVHESSKDDALLATFHDIPSSIEGKCREIDGSGISVNQRSERNMERRAAECSPFKTDSMPSDLKPEFPEAEKSSSLPPKQFNTDDKCNSPINSVPAPHHGENQYILREDLPSADISLQATLSGKEGHEESDEDDDIVIPATFLPDSATKSYINETILSNKKAQTTYSKPNDNARDAIHESFTAVQTSDDATNEVADAQSSVSIDPSPPLQKWKTISVQPSRRIPTLLTSPRQQKDTINFSESQKTLSHVAHFPKYPLSIDPLPSRELLNVTTLVPEECSGVTTIPVKRSMDTSVMSSSTKRRYTLEQQPPAKLRVMAPSMATRFPTAQQLHLSLLGVPHVDPPLSRSSASASAIDMLPRGSPGELSSSQYHTVGSSGSHGFKGEQHSDTYPVRPNQVLASTESAILLKQGEKINPATAEISQPLQPLLAKDRNSLVLPRSGSRSKETGGGDADGEACLFSDDEDGDMKEGVASQIDRIQTFLQRERLRRGRKEDTP